MDHRELIKSLQESYSYLQKKTMKKWKRDLPFDEMIFDRWKRAESLGFGNNANIYHNSYVYGDVQVADNTWIGPYTILDGSGGLSIGRFCSISAGVKIYTHDSIAWALSGGMREYEKAPVIIGDCCHIGSDSIVIKGVTIGDHTVVGANSFVNSNLPSYSIAFGNPCRKHGEVVIDGDGEITLVMDTIKKTC